MDFIDLSSEEQLLNFDDIGFNAINNFNFENIGLDGIAELSNQVALDSPWGKDSLFYTSKYITENIDFVKLVAFIKAGKDVEFDYKKFIGSSTRTINKSISYGEEAKFDRMANIPTSYSTTQQYEIEIPITVKSYSQERVLNLQGKLNAIKDTINLYNNGPKDRTGGLEFEFDYKKRIVNYKVHFYYVGKNRVFEKDNKDNIAITISSSSFEDFAKFLSLCGRGLDLDRIAGNSDFEIEIKDAFLSALKEVTGRDDKGTYGEKLDPIKFRDLDWLYQNIPVYVAKELNFDQSIENIFKLSFWDGLNSFGDDTTAAITNLLTKLDHKNVCNYFQKNPDKLISLYNNFSDDSLVEKLCQYLTAITFYYKQGEIDNPRTFTSSDAAHIETNILFGDDHGKVELTNELQMPLMPFNNLSLLNWVTKDAEINNPKNASNQFHPLDIIYIFRYDPATNATEKIPTIALYGKHLGDKGEWSDVIDASLAVVDIVSIAISAGVLSAGVRGVARIFAIIDITFSTINLALLSPGVKSILNKTEAGRWFVTHWGIISFCVSAGTISYYLAKGILKYGSHLRKGLNDQDELAKQVDELVKESKKIEESVEFDYLANWTNVSGRGANLGQKLSSIDIQKTEQYISTIGYEFHIFPEKGTYKVDDYFLSNGAPATFDAKAQAAFVYTAHKAKFIIRTKATMLNVFHELMHAKHAKVLGLQNYHALGGRDTYGEFIKETYVLEKIIQNKHLFTRDEIEFSLEYVNDIRRYWGREAIKLDFDVQTIPIVRKQIKIEEILNIE